MGKQLKVDSGQIRRSANGMQGSAAQLHSKLQAFQQAWQEPEAPVPALQDGQVAANIMGAGLMICGMIVLALKITVIIQLVWLAVQIAMVIAEAPVTFGASLAQIPIVKMITGMLIDLAISMALEAILGGS